MNKPDEFSSLARETIIEKLKKERQETTRLSDQLNKEIKSNKELNRSLRGLRIHSANLEKLIGENNYE